MPRNIYPNQNPSTPAKNIYVNEFGTWKPAQAIWVNQSGSWTKVWPARNAWSVSGAELTSTYTRGGAFWGSITGLDFSTDGTRMFMTQSYSDFVYMFSLSTPWEVNTASQIGAYSYNTTTNKDVARNLFFRSDGTRFYIHYDSKYIYSWPMSTPWDVTTAGTSNNKLFPDAVGTTTSDYFITPNGLNLVGITDNVTTFDFTNRVASTAWSLTSFPSSPNTTTPQSISANSGAIRPDGTQIFTVSLAGAVNTFNLSTANNVTTATNANITFTAGPFASQPSSIRFSTDGTKMYIMDFFPGTVYQYNLV